MTAIPPRPIALPLRADALPAELGRLRRFVGWRYTWKPGDGNGKPGKWDKPPFDATHPAQLASSTDPATWRSFDEARAAVEDGKFDGIGIAPGVPTNDKGEALIDDAGNRLAAVDLDHCVSEDGQLEPWARAIVDRLHTYTERSPSGRGLRLLLWADCLPPNGRKKGNIEIYNSGHYVTLTGQHLEDTPTTIEERTSEIAAVHAQVFAAKSSKKHHGDEQRRATVPTGDDDATLIERAKRAANGSKFSSLWVGDWSGYSSQSEADSALCLMLTFWIGRDEARIDRVFRQSGLMRDKWNERRGDATYGERTIAGAVACCTETYRERVATPHVETMTEDDAATTAATGVQLGDFYAYMPMHAYIFTPAREVWPGTSVNARVPPVPILDTHGNPIVDPVLGVPRSLKATTWLDQHHAVEQMTWVPGMPMLIRDRLLSEGGWIDRPGCTTFNLYRPPHDPVTGQSGSARPWLDHIHRIYPADIDHIVAWLAHRVQRPAEKINHALVLGGLQGVGKDTLLEPVKHAVGPWNFAEVSPTHLLGRFNSFVKSVILRISEARDLGNVDRYGFYDHLKIYTAVPPDVLRVDEKNLREYAAWNVCGVVITTNHRIGGLYLPADDRRHYVAWTDCTKDDFPDDYWTQLYEWYERGGTQHVAAYLRAYDLSGFNPKAPPAKTPAFWDLVDADRAPEDAELADALDRLGYPAAVTLNDLVGPAQTAFAEWLHDRKNARQVPYRMQMAGYVPVRNDAAKDGLWKLSGRRQVVYARHDLALRDRLIAARELGGDR